MLDRHLPALGRPAKLAAAGDLEMKGTLDTGGVQQSWRLLVRRSPFAVREEFLRPGAAAPFVAVTDGEQAWRLPPDRRSQPLPAPQAAHRVRTTERGS